MVSYEIDEERINKTEGLKYVFERFGRDFSLKGFFLQGVLMDDDGEFRLTYSQHLKSDLVDRTYQIVFFLKDIDNYYDVHVNTQKTAIEGIDITIDTSGHFVFSDNTNSITILCGDFRIEFHDSLSKKFAKEKREYLIEKNSPRYIKKICSLNDLKYDNGSFVFNRDDTYNGIKADRHIMYKLPSLHNEDRSIYYEFLIEFDKKDPSLGIYYGCKGLIKKGDNEEKIKEMDEVWKKLSEEVIKRLNILFPDKKFDNRVKLTDNANDNTYWPFWIPLYDDENVTEVAARATIIIRDEYKRFLENPYKADDTSKFRIDREKVKIKMLKGELHSVTRFTEESWESLKRPWVISKTKSQKGKGITESDLLEIADNIWEELLIQFVESSKKMELLEELSVENNDKYEKAFRLNCQMNQFKYMLVSLINGPMLEKYKEKYKEIIKVGDLKFLKLPNDARGVPWEKVAMSFVSKNKEGFKLDSLKNVRTKSIEKETKELFEKIMQSTERLKSMVDKNH